MIIDPTINIGILLQIVAMLVGVAIAVGVFKQKNKDMEDKFARFEGTVDKLETSFNQLSVKLEHFSVVHERFSSLEKRIDGFNEEMSRARDRIHDLDREMRIVQRAQER